MAESGALVMWRGVADKAEKYVGYGQYAQCKQILQSELGAKLENLRSTRRWDVLFLFIPPPISLIHLSA